MRLPHTLRKPGGRSGWANSAFYLALAEQQDVVSYLTNMRLQCAIRDIPWAYREFCSGFGAYNLKTDTWKEYVTGLLLGVKWWTATMGLNQIDIANISLCRRLHWALLIHSTSLTYKQNRMMTHFHNLCCPYFRYVIPSLLLTKRYAHNVRDTKAVHQKQFQASIYRQRLPIWQKRQGACSRHIFLWMSCN